MRPQPHAYPLKTLYFSAHGGWYGGCSMRLAAMLISHREVRFLETDAIFEIHAAVTTSFRVRVLAQRRVVADDALFLHSMEREPKSGRPMVSVLLSGAARMRA